MLAVDFFWLNKYLGWIKKLKETKTTISYHQFSEPAGLLFLISDSSSGIFSAVGILPFSPISFLLLLSYIHSPSLPFSPSFVFVA